MPQNDAKIISLVPSWTETFIECGVQVIGRTRYCIHPHDRVQKIPVVGGTKSLKIDDILALQPDFVVLDREENKKEMADQLELNGIRLVVSHVENIDSAADFLRDLSHQWQNEKLMKLSERYRDVLQKRNNLSLKSFIKKSIAEAAVPELETLTEKLRIGVQYVIWKSPFMTIGPQTFISQVLDLFGIKLLLAEDCDQTNIKYPVVSEEVLKKYFCLFSTEPYPFARQIHNLREAGFQGVLIDGELISWYGIRNLRFLESCLLDKR